MRHNTRAMMHINNNNPVDDPRRGSAGKYRSSLSLPSNSDVYPLEEKDTLSPMAHGGMNTSKRSEERKIARKAIREICLYSIFLLFFSASAILEAQDQDLYWLGANIQNQLIDTEWEAGIPKFYRDVATIKEFNTWLKASFYNTLYLDVPYTGTSESRYPGYIAGINKIVGGVRIGQLRVGERECTTNSFSKAATFKEQQYNFKCFGGNRGQFTLESESKEDFGEGARKFEWAGWGDSSMSVDEWRSMLYTNIRTGHNRGFTFPAYGVILPNHNATEAIELLRYLDTNRYIDRQTRLVVIDFTVYNAQTDLWTIHQYQAEVPKVGGMIVSQHYSTVRLYTLFESTTTTAILLEVIVMLFFAYYSIKEVGVILSKSHKLAYVTQPATIAHNANLLAFVAVYVLRSIALATAPDPASVVVDSNVFYNFRTASSFRRAAQSMNAVNAFLSWFKLVRFMSYFPRFALVTNTLYIAAAGVSGFAIIFLIVFYGFSAAFMISFGRVLFDYRNLTSSVYSLLKALLGEFDLNALVEADWVLGILLFATFVCVAVFVVLNVLIAIISDSYNAAQQELKRSQDIQLGSEIRDVLMGTLSRFCPCLVRAGKKARATVASLHAPDVGAMVQKGRRKLSVTGKAVLRSNSGRVRPSPTPSPVLEAAESGPASAPPELDTVTSMAVAAGADDLEVQAISDHNMSTMGMHTPKGARKRHEVPSAGL